MTARRRRGLDALLGVGYLVLVAAFVLAAVLIYQRTFVPSTEVELELPVYAVLEYKVVFDWRPVQETEVFSWEEGENRYLLVEPSSEPVTVEVGFRRPPEEECDGSP